MGLFDRWGNFSVTLEGNPLNKNNMKAKNKFKGIKKPKKGCKMECCLNSVKCEFKGFEFSCMAREYNQKKQN